MVLRELARACVRATAPEGSGHLPGPRAARALDDVIMYRRLANAMIERNGGRESSSLGGRLMALLHAREGPSFQTNSSKGILPNKFVKGQLLICTSSNVAA